MKIELSLIGMAAAALIVALVVALAVLLSCLFHYVPGLNAVPSGWALILAAVTASAVGAWRFPHVEPQGGAAS